MKTSESFFNAVAKFAGVDVNDVKNAKSQREVVEQFIIMSVVKENVLAGMADDDFMNFMAEWGRYCWLVDSTSGSTLYEIAMKRILNCSRYVNAPDIGPLVAKREREYVPSKALGLPFSDACFEFLKQNLATLLCDVDTHCKQQAQRIVFGIMDSIDENGQVKGYAKNDDVLKVSQLEIRRFVEAYVLLIDEEIRWLHYANVGDKATYAWVKSYGKSIERMPLNTLIKSLAPKWRENLEFFFDFYHVIDWNVLIEAMDLDKENFVSPFMTKVLKFLGLYNWYVKFMIQSEIKG